MSNLNAVLKLLEMNQQSVQACEKALAEAKQRWIDTVALLVTAEIESVPCPYPDCGAQADERCRVDSGWHIVRLGRSKIKK